MLAYVLAIVVVLVAALLALFLPPLIPLQGAWHWGFVIVVLALGVAAAIIIIVLHRRAKKEREQLGEDAGTTAISELDLMLADAQRKLRTSQQGAKTLESMPLLYILGEAGSAKTTTVLRSGLDPEMLAGTATLDGEQVPTGMINLWFTKAAALLEVGASIRQSNALLGRLIHRTRAKAYRSAFGTGAAPRAVVVCLSADQLLAGDAGQSLIAAARTTGAQLREISRLLGMPVPVFVIVTKLDRVPHFAEYVRNLTDAEVRQILGLPLPRSEASAGVYAEQASRMLSAAIDGLVYKLGEFRIEMLDRESEPGQVPGVYEFPRELGKIRKSLNQYLVELCKPSQLSANPYLRGFYFTGIRARMVERAAAVVAPAAIDFSTPQDAGATVLLDAVKLRAAAARTAAASPAMTPTRVPQWTFLPRLLPEVILGDRSALTATRQSAPAKIFRRILFGTLAFLFLLYTVLLIIAYFNNAALEKRIQNDARALPPADATATRLPGLAELKALDDLRLTIAQLDEYERTRVPLGYRFGLYHGRELDEQARKVYFDRFRPMLLNPAQSGFLTMMRALTPASSTDFGLYNAAYNPLKAYLITTSNNDKSDPKFLTPVFLQYWIGSRTNLEAEQQDLARKQIDFYGNELLRQPPPYSITTDSMAVERSRAYLNNFRGVARVYQAMLADGDKAGPSIDFNKLYPGVSSFVQAPKVVRGAFSKEGFAFMQGAVKNPDKYAGGEIWVLGDKGGATTPVSSSDLWSQYSGDFLKEWRSFLSTAHVVNCTGVKDAEMRLNALAAPSSPILELFYVVSHNTAVADNQIKSVFQPTQVLVDPNNPDKLIGPGNAIYITALTNLAGAVDLATQNPNPPDPQAAFAPVQQQMVLASGAVQQVAQAFTVDSQAHTETVVMNLMKAPIECVDKNKPSVNGAINGQADALCNPVNRLLAKYPFFNNSTVMASVPEVDQAFAPAAGQVWAAKNGAFKPIMAQQGAQFVAVPPAQVNPKFLNFYNRAAHITSELYPNNAASATFTFNLRFIPGNFSSATFVMDGQRMAPGSNTQTFTWTGTTAQSAYLIYDGTQDLQNTGTWSVFQLVRTAQITKTAGGYRLDYILKTTIQGHNSGQSGPQKMITFELSGPGADFLVGEGFAGAACVQPLPK